MKNIFNNIKSLIFWLLLLSFVVFYPMLISIYVFLPLLIGLMGYIFIRGLETGKFSYIFLGLIYFINIEANLTLPFFLIIIAILLVYSLFYFNLKILKKCKICKPVITVILIDLIYLGMLLSYDFIFQTTSLVLDDILVYSLIVDILMVVLI